MDAIESGSRGAAAAGGHTTAPYEAKDHRLGGIPIRARRSVDEQEIPERFGPLKPILLDTGVIVAWLDASDHNHKPCVEALEEVAAPLVTCEAVIFESCHILRRAPGAVEAVLKNVTSGVFQIPLQLSGAAFQVHRIMRKYRDQGIDLADACLVHMANEMRTGDILTLDSHFKVFRWAGNKPFHPLVRL